ncbi:VWA domain-containing protein [Lactobacillus sp.]|uniref:VWA domain-containing protein n=1 Tax=Lactobacillus sp. TaxID=1591 RepID=UPI003F1154EB
MMKTTAETIELKSSFLPDLLAFGDYLLKLGYQLMPNYAEEILALLADSFFDQPDVSLWNYQLLLKPLMVKSQAEAQHFQEDLRNYLQLKNSLRDKEEALARNHEELEGVMRKFDQEEASLEEEGRQLAQEKNGLPGSFKIPKTWLKRLDKLQAENAAAFKALFADSPKQELFAKMAKTLADKDQSGKREIFGQREDLLAELEKAAGKLTDLPDPMAGMQLLEELGKILKRIDLQDKRLKRAGIKQEKKQGDLEQSRQDAGQEAGRLQMRINELQSRLTSPGKREWSKEANQGMNFVDNTGLLAKPFASLSKLEREQISDYVNLYAYKFKAQVAKRLISPRKGRIDLAASIKLACKSGGVPLKLQYQHPKKRPCKLVIFLDVSGSCIKAAEPLFLFACCLRELFPTGCELYAFVDHLVDLSSDLKAGMAYGELTEVLRKVPTIGVYSDYGKPLREYKDKQGQLNKRTIMLWMGDARNNHLPSEEKIFKDLCQRVKRCYWLNPEAKSKWDTGDSVIGSYAPYVDELAEVTNPASLIKFLCELQN